MTPKSKQHDQFLSASAVTKSASKQTYYTIKYLVDPDLVQDAYRAYAYFRWVDDQIDQGTMDRDGLRAFIQRQKALIQDCAQRKTPQDATSEEQMLVQLVQNNRPEHNGLMAYITNMMKVMEIDATRRGELITRAELQAYTHTLATAVTEALHYFIGHNCDSPSGEARYHAVIGAHITHMLRDTYDDIQAGYFNVPQDYLRTHAIMPQDVTSNAYHDWVRGQVRLARAYFQSGKERLAHVQSTRCALAGYAYIARFEWVLDTIEADGFNLRPSYAKRKRLPAAIKMGWSALAMFLKYRRPGKTFPVMTILEEEL